MKQAERVAGGTLAVRALKADVARKRVDDQSEPQFPIEIGRATVGTHCLGSEGGPAEIQGVSGSVWMKS